MQDYGIFSIFAPNSAWAHTEVTVGNLLWTEWMPAGVLLTSQWLVGTG